MPITLGQEFGGYAANVAPRGRELERTAEQLHELNLGATAVGTGLNAGDDFTRRAIAQPRARTPACRCSRRANRFRVTQSMGDVLAYSGALRRLAVEVDKIASDLRLLSSGPRAGIAEIQLPAVQPGSSIMPGKVNPSVPEMVNQVCQQVLGCDATILAAAAGGQLELNVMMPVMAWNALHATTILGKRCACSPTRCVTGIVADEARCRELLDRSTAVATALSPYIGYAATADIAKTAVKTGRRSRDIVRERKLMPDDAARRHPVARSDDVAGYPGRRQRGRSSERPCSASAALALGVSHAALGRRARSRRSTRGCFRRRISACSKGPTATPGSGPIRSWTRSASAKAASSPTSAPAAAGSPCGWRAASDRTAGSTPKTSSPR